MTTSQIFIFYIMLAGAKKMQGELKNVQEGEHEQHEREHKHEQQNEQEQHADGKM
jgi:hypothetical protein